MNNKNKKKKINPIYDIDYENLRITQEDSNKKVNGKAIIYARVSTDEQVKEGHGIESQINTCKQWALANNVEIVKIFVDEGISGSKLDRVGLNEAISFLERQNKYGVRVHFFITTEASRISRSSNLMDTLEVDENIRKTGAKIIYTMHPTDTSTDEGRFIQNFQYVIASYERDKIRARTINGIKSKIYQGIRPWVCPMGYEVVKTGKEKYFKIKEVESDILKEALNLYANGTFEYKYDIIDYLNNNGIKRNGKKIHKSFIDRLLDYKKLFFYAGYLIWPEEGITEFIPGQHEALIDLTTAKKILFRLEKRGRNADKSIFQKEKKEFIFKGYLYCPFCGEKMSAAFSSNRKGEKFGYYYCYNKHCPNKKKGLNEKYIEECFKTYLNRFKIKDPLWEVFKLFLQVNWKEKEKMLGKLQLEKRKRYLELMKETKDIEDKLISITNPALIKKLEQRWAEVEQEKIVIKEQLDNNDLLEIHWKDLYKKAEFLFSNPAGLFEVGDFQIKKLLVKLFTNGKIYGTKKEAFEKLLEQGVIKPPFVKSDDTISSTNSQGVVCKNYLFRTEANDSLNLLFDYILECNIPNLDLTGIEPVYRSKAV